MGEKFPENTREFWEKLVGTNAWRAICRPTVQKSESALHFAQVGVGSWLRGDVSTDAQIE